MSARIPSSGSQWVITELSYMMGKQTAALGTAGGGLLGLAPDSNSQTTGAISQAVANILDGAIDLVSEGIRPQDLARGKLLPMMAKAGLGAYQLGTPTQVAFMAACGALAIDGALAIACPPVGAGMVFCAISLTFDAMAVGGAAGGLPSMRSKDGEAFSRQKIFRDRCMVVLPQKQFYNWKFEANDPANWSPWTH